MGNDDSDSLDDELGQLTSRYQKSNYYDNIPETVGNYSIDVNNPILIRWVYGDEYVECSLSSDDWSSRVKQDGVYNVLHSSGDITEALEVSLNYMDDGSEDVSIEERDTIGSDKIVEEVEEILDEVPELDDVKNAFE